MTPDRARVQGCEGWELNKTWWDGRFKEAMPPGSITWDEHMEAWHEYERRYPGQSAERLAERGGFGHWELREFLGHEPTTFVIHPQSVKAWEREPGGKSYGNGESWSNFEEE